ncbi:M23 family metallopeptidase [Hyphomonas sp.]|uniref:M23 family metallopeptidase n=1 Tax=Hyphomonas sp. TaxID=87 RepID=UPI00391D913A
MRRAYSAAGLAFILATLAGCDVVRFPGDGRPPPELPPVGPVTPPPADPSPDIPVPDPAGGDPAIPDDPSTEVPVDPQPDDPATPDPVPQPDPEPEPEPEPEPPAPPPPPPPPPAPVFSFYAPGALLPGTGGGFPEQIVHAPDMLFPIKSAPAYLQSQVYTFGGGIAGGDQCDARNYAYPWRDNFCETRTADRGTPFCPVHRVHQGQDIRVGTAADCNALRRQTPSQRGLHEVIAVEDGVITSVGTYTVKLRAGGTIYNYMHLNMNRLSVTAGQSVRAGDLLGYVSNDFGGTPTTIHLHFEIVQNSGAHGWVHVAPYLSLVAAYERRQNGPGERLEQPVVTASEEIWQIPEGFVFTD